MEIQNRRSRSSRRLRHEAQVKVFSSQKGSLEAIRQELGLRPSQICEILKVHPSAWIRWTKKETAPPHVYQMLEWYLELLKWRGQHSGSVPQVLSQQDPQAFVPPPPSTELKPRFSLEGAAFFKILAISVIFQIATTLVVVFYFIKR